MIRILCLKKKKFKNFKQENLQDIPQRISVKYKYCTGEYNKEMY